MSIVAMALVAFAMAASGPTMSFWLAGATLVLAVAVAWQVYQAVAGLRRHNDSIRSAARTAECHYISVLQRIVHFVEARDGYSSGRSRRIGLLAEAMAQQMKLAPARCELMNLAGQLHDLGMLAVSDNIVGKRALLASKEFRVVQTHAHVSCELLAPLESLQEALPAIRFHHERMNGTGYPQGIKREEIPLEARILAVADSYDAMTHDRPHRGALSPLDAMAELRRCTPAGYDPACVEALAAVVHLPRLQRAMFECEEEAAVTHA